MLIRDAKPLRLNDPATILAPWGPANPRRCGALVFRSSFEALLMEPVHDREGGGGDLHP